ncbi:hypothetical protein [Nonomuraea zeae]|uniref:Uncharacterized protein n=1 Tax=Nonomuraea zeae TaxID=1642303 RepID=A0A5S4HJP8_9ACTN|nr:hypothetical protein [Nonomuraea zeae]TMR39640.1 hypothetical protein ETD85_01100 [Nonomuraea zeae]
MEIFPGTGVHLVQVGDRRTEVESRIGGPVHDRSSKNVYDTAPMLIIHYAQDDRVELVEIGYSGSGGEEVFFDGVQLTYRFMDEVVSDLAAKGHAGTPSDIGVTFQAGFSVWSMGSLWAGDLDPEADEDDERSIVEGVSVAPYSYWDEG